MNRRFLIIATGSILLLGSLLRLTNGGLWSADRRYPNELPSLRFYEASRWKVIEPFVSDEADVLALLGKPEKVYYDEGEDWKLIVLYVGEGTCDGKPWPSFLMGKVDSIQLIPKRRVSLSGVKFSDSFERSEVHAPHDAAPSYSYADANGLEYDVYNRDARDGSVSAGDLQAILYGPSRSTYRSLSGCN